MRKDYILLLLWVVFPAALFILLYGIRYLKYKETMALIERNRELPDKHPRAVNLLWGLLFIGIAIGFIAGMVLTRTLLTDFEPLVVYLMTLSLFTGIALVIYHKTLQK